MGFYDWLAQNNITGVNGEAVHPGSKKILGVALPDFGITERDADRMNIPRDENGGSQIVGAYPTKTYDNTINNYNAVKATNDVQRQVVASGGGGGGQVPVNQVPTNTDPTGGKSAEQIQAELYAQRVASAQNSLSILLNNIEQQKGFAKESRDTVQGHLGNSYWGNASDIGSLNPSGGLIGSNQAKKTSELGLLDENLGQVNDLYQGNKEKGMKGYIESNQENKGRVLDTLDKNAADAGAEADRVLGTNARKYQDSNTLNRVLAKARGMGGSSTYQSMQDKGRYQAETLGKEVNADKANKIFETGIEKGNQSNWYDTKDSELKTEHSGKVTTINGEKVSTETFHNNLDTQYRGDYDTAWKEENTNYESQFQNLLTQGEMYGIDNADRLDSLYADHQTRLSAIADYASKAGTTGTDKRVNTINTNVAGKQKTVDDRSSLKNIASDLAKNKSVETMNSGKLGDTYSTTIGDSSINQNSLNAVLASMKDIGLPQEANASAKMNIRRPTSLLDEQDKYGYLINNLFGKAYA